MMTDTTYILFEDIPLEMLDGHEPRVTWQTVFDIFGGQDRFMRRMLTRRAFRRWRGRTRDS